MELLYNIFADPFVQMVQAPDFLMQVLMGRICIRYSICIDRTWLCLDI